MLGKPLARTFHEKAVKSIIGDGLLDCEHICGRDAELKKTKGKSTKSPFLNRSTSG
jgi:hypothetical protein